jgi:hypothetical protein
MEDLKVFSTIEWGARPATQSFPQHAAKGIVIHNMETSIVPLSKVMRKGKHPLGSV